MYSKYCEILGWVMVEATDTYSSLIWINARPSSIDHHA